MLPGFPPILGEENCAKESLMRERSPQSMLKWIRKTYDMSPGALAHMFQKSPRTIHTWLSEGRISTKNGTKIRSSYYYLNNERDPHAGRFSATDMY
jgi:hypothetical protein